jgi:hypothetical protein
VQAGPAARGRPWTQPCDLGPKPTGIDTYRAVSARPAGEVGSTRIPLPERLCRLYRPPTTPWLWSRRSRTQCLDTIEDRAAVTRGDRPCQRASNIFRVPNATSDASAQAALSAALHDFSRAARRARGRAARQVAEQAGMSYPTATRMLGLEPGRPDPRPIHTEVNRWPIL